MADFNPDQLNRIERDYRALLARAEQAYSDLGGDDEAERLAREATFSSEHDVQVIKLLEVLGRLVEDLRSGGLGNLLNFLHNRDFFLDIERIDPTGMKKFFAQLPNQSPPTLDEIEEILGEWVVDFSPHFQTCAELTK